MKTLVIGSTGFVGKALCARLLARDHYVTGTQRDKFDLAKPISELPCYTASVVYQVAYIPGFYAAATHPDAYTVNIEAQIRIADLALKSGMFPVFISSDAVEYAFNTPYGYQKATVEAYFRGINGAIVRPTRIVERRVTEFADFLIGVGEKRERGVYRWK